MMAFDSTPEIKLNFFFSKAADILLQFTDALALTPPTSGSTE